MYRYPALKKKNMATLTMLHEQTLKHDDYTIYLTYTILYLIFEYNYIM